MNNIETLVVAGCSHTFGAETVNEDYPVHPDSINYAYGKFLSEKLNCGYVNLAYSGISNFDISRRVQQFVDFSKVDPEKLLVIIGWTDPNRFTFYPEILIMFFESLIKGENHPYNLSAYTIDHSKVNKDLEKGLKCIKKLDNGDAFLSFFRKYLFESDYFYDLNYMLRVQTSAFLRSKGIRHLTFSTLKEKKYKNTYKYEFALSSKNNILEYKDNFNFYDAFRRYGIYRGGHLKVPAHEACAAYLHTELVKRKIL